MTTRPILLTDRDVESLLTLEEALQVTEEAVKQQALGLMVNPPRARFSAAPGVSLHSMMAAAPGLGVVGFKVFTFAGSVFRSHVFLYEIQTGKPLSIMEANRLGQLRTGAATGVAAGYLAHQDASRAGIFGSGYQARAQLEALCKVRPIREAVVYSPTPDHRRAFAEEMSRRLEVEVKPVDEPRKAVEGLPVVVCATSSRKPVFDGHLLAQGAFLACMGAHTPYTREVDDAAVLRSRLLVVDNKAQARLECGELLQPISRGLARWEQVRELWEVVGGHVQARERPDDIVLFKSLGIALWDIAAARAVYRKARKQKVGLELPA